MTVSTVTLIPEPKAGSGLGATAETALNPLDAELIERVSRPDYDRWLRHAVAAGGCTRPVRLYGEVVELDSHGEILSTLRTSDRPDGMIYKPCGTRRASSCPACAETYRRDAYQLIKAGLIGGKGVPESVAFHPCVFVTLTAPSFGPVHTRRTTTDGRVLACRPRRKPQLCPHGRDLRCRQTHKDGEDCLGKPLCPACFDYAGAVVWNAHAGELWRRTTIALHRRLGRLARRHGVAVRARHGKAAETQARGLMHFHVLIRLDGYNAGDPDRILPPPPCISVDQLAQAVREVVAATWFATIPHPVKPAGWDIAWGDQLDIRTVRQAPTDEITDAVVASYLAKYATKSTEAAGGVAVRITTANLDIYADRHTHIGRLIRTAWQLGHHTHPDFAALRRWAHMLGFRGHYFTKSRRYSTTFRTLRAARQVWRRRQHRSADHISDDTTLVVGLLTYAGTGWRTTADALLALSAAAKARERAHVAREEIAYAI